jgi:hypothetical protein
MSAIKWAFLDEQTFNRLVEALLVAEYSTDGIRVMAPDGRGGDGGIDVGLYVERTSQFTQIYQLKYFPEGFSGGFSKTRRKQIKESLETAIKAHNPPVWTLITPKNATVKERMAVMAMRKTARTIIRFMGPTELDVLLSRHRNIEAYFTRSEAIEALREVGREEAALAKPDDLRTEVKRIQSRIDGRSAFWGTAVTLSPDGSIIESIYAKHPDAADREPLNISISMRFSPEDEALRSAYEEKINFGGSGVITLPERVLQEVKREGPEWFASVSSGGELVLTTAAEPISHHVKVHTAEASGRQLRQLTGLATLFDRGLKGSTVETTFHGGLDLIWRFPDDTDSSGNVAFSFAPEGSTPREIRQVLRFIQSITPGNLLNLTVQNMPVLQMQTSQETSFQPEPALEAFISDLCVIEDKLDVVFRIPHEGVSTSDRLWARVLVMLLDGKGTAYPLAESFHGTLSGETSPALEHLLTEGGAICISHNDFEVELLGTRVQLGKILVYTHHATVNDGKTILTAMSAGNAAGLQFTVTPVDGTPFVAFAPEYGRNGEESVVLAYPWELPGVSEHAGLDRLPNRKK